MVSIGMEAMRLLIQWIAVPMVLVCVFVMAAALVEVWRGRDPVS